MDGPLGSSDLGGGLDGLRTRVAVGIVPKRGQRISVTRVVTVSPWGAIGLFGRTVRRPFLSRSLGAPRNQNKEIPIVGLELTTAAVEELEIDVR